jgi:hypothetical protein
VLAWIDEDMPKNETFIVVAYGSLLSGYGILAKRRGGRSRLVARDAFPATLTNARRGLAKPSSHGSYLAMDLEPIAPEQPLVAHSGGDASEGIGVLALEFAREAAPLVAQREEYEPSKFVQLFELAEAAGRSLGEFLWAIAERTKFNLLAYRTALRELLGYTSHGYIFHPVPFADGRIGIAAIGSGYDGSGDPAIPSKRREYGMDRLLSLPEALRVSSLELDREGQVGYFVECLLGGLHGLGVADLAAELAADDALSVQLRERLSAAAPLETGLFLEATSLDAERYRRRFSRALHQNLEPLFARGQRAS